jgi:hypothetical protein
MGWTGYTPVVMSGVVSSTDASRQIAVSVGSATFASAVGYTGVPVAGYAITCVMTDGTELVVSIRPFNGGPIDPSMVTGNYIVQWSMQRYDGP